MSRYKLRANYDIENIDSQKMDGTVIVDVPMLSNGELNYGLSHIKKKLYEENIGLINGVVAEWLIEISQTIDYNLFKKAIEIATDRGKCNKGYVSGIIKQWLDNNIRTYDDLKAYEIGVKNRRDESGEYSQYKYANTNERENEEYTRRPTAEEIEEIRRSIDEIRRNRGQL